MWVHIATMRMDQPLHIPPPPLIAPPHLLPVLPSTSRWCLGKPCTRLGGFPQDGGELCCILGSAKRSGLYLVVLRVSGVFGRGHSACMCVWSGRVAS